MTAEQAGLTEYQLTAEQCIWARAAVLKHVGKTLSKLKEDAITAGKGSLATEIDREIGALQDETVEKLSKAASNAPPKKGKVPVSFSIMEIRALDAGLPKLIRDMRAAKGTVGSLGKDHWVEELEREAKAIGEQLVPQFSENRDVFEPEEPED